MRTAGGKFAAGFGAFALVLFANFILPPLAVEVGPRDRVDEQLGVGVLRVGNHTVHIAGLGHRAMKSTII